MRSCSILGLSILVTIVAAQPTFAQQPDLRPKINVSARATETVVPDEIVLSFSIRTRAPTATEAAQKNSAQIKSVIEYLTSQNVQRKDIATERIQLSPIYSRQPRQVKAQQAAIQSNIPQSRPNSNFPARGKASVEGDVLKPSAFGAVRSISVVIRSVDQFEKIYLGMVERGVNSISNIQTRSSTIVEKRAEVRLKAIAAARTKAESMASVLGAKLKSVISISEGSPYAAAQSAIPFGDDPFSSGSEALAVGTIEIASSVSVTFELGDTELK